MVHDCVVCVLHPSTSIPCSCCLCVEDRSSFSVRPDGSCPVCMVRLVLVQLSLVSVRLESFLLLVFAHHGYDPSVLPVGLLLLLLCMLAWLAHEAVYIL